MSGESQRDHASHEAWFVVLRRGRVRVRIYFPKPSAREKLVVLEEGSD